MPISLVRFTGQLPIHAIEITDLVGKYEFVFWGHSCGFLVLGFVFFF